MYILSFDVGLKNLAYCIYDTVNDKIQKWSVDTIISQKNEDTCRSLVRHLDSISLQDNVSVVLIEKQPSKNNKMRIIEALLNAYFVIKKPELKIIVYSAKHKLGSDTFKGKHMYKERKNLSVNRCNHYLKNKQSEYLDFFQKSKKKDDLADSLLQVLSYCKRDNFETPEEGIENICKVSMRKPTASQEKKGYSKSNLKYLIFNNENINLENQIFTKSLFKFYKKCKTPKEALDEACKDFSIDISLLKLI
tara:strand:- start:2734 stop:3480 length:747 start_codon:yes stop_codon:yes gene_type:complete